MNELSVLDFIIIAFTLFGMVKGFRIGLIQSVVGLVGWLALIVKKLLESLKLSFLDKMAGGALGSGKNVLIILVVLNFSFPILAKMPVWQNSMLAPELLPYAPLAKELIQKTMGDAWQQVETAQERSKKVKVISN